MNDKISSHVDISDPEMISITENAFDHICQKYINLKDQAVRDALIKLGWTPPGEPIVISEGKEFICGMNVMRWHGPSLCLERTGALEPKVEGYTKQ